MDDAAASYRHALLVGDPSAMAAFNLANVLRALESCSQAVEIEPDFADAWNNLGTLLIELGRPDDACASFRRALAADPAAAGAHYNLADTLDEQVGPARAEAAKRAGLIAAPTPTSALAANSKLDGQLVTL
jgi:tetratricopeptide (TPR) repeat protein